MLRALLTPRIVLAAVGLALALAFVNLVNQLASTLVGFWTTRGGAASFARDGTIELGGRILYLPPLVASLVAFLVVLWAAATLIRRVDLRGD